jgi:hypothetical protein
MALDKDKLAADLKAMGEKAIFDPSKNRPWTAEEAMSELAAIIDTFVKSAAVKGVTVEVTTSSGTATGTQTGAGRLE